MQSTARPFQRSAADVRPGSARPLYAEVADLLRQRILQQKLMPGAWIDEMKLAEEMGISRTPMREAIKVLAAEGLVTIKVRRGAYVTEIPEDEVREIYHLLGLLESDAAADVARTATESELQHLTRLHQQLEAQGRQLVELPGDTALIDQFFATNQAFHQFLLDASRNRWRTQIVNDLRKVMQLGRHHSLFKQGRVQQSMEEHAAILLALVARDPQAAAQAMRMHFAQGLQAIG
ncbi:MAG: GntR family transcriptional regulator [Brachymonas denitrificans]|jgi:DNA-binding GntR family transcriptional regulator|uniref:GntR family transcriptional regulator n=1 Tax=Brachymonas denitrificans TaxID=28220 RepID=UPI001BCFEA0E|nr:GntR family transcriptional regulator [Brachymonas denitrificans]